MKSMLMFLTLSLCASPAFSYHSLDFYYQNLKVETISPVTIKGLPVHFHSAAAVCKMAGYTLAISKETQVMTVEQFYAADALTDDSLTLHSGTENGKITAPFLTSVDCVR